MRITKIEKLTFTAEDGYVLSGTFYQVDQAKANIVLASATGVPQGFYKAFAEYANQQGFQVLTFDYRGIAASAPKRLKGFRMSYLDWGRYDLSAAIDVLAHSSLPIFMVGHSYGGQALGLSRNHHLVSAMYCFGTGAGWSGYMPKLEKLKVDMFWNIVFPPLAHSFGYLPWQKLNMGADLPLDVYRQWKYWCQFPHYFFDDSNHAALHTQYAEVKTPIYAVNALDDAWALPPSRDAFMQHYRSAALQYIDLEPGQYGLATIGHMGYFRRSAQHIWQEMLDQFSKMI
jgi:predicted alpha/beta hydrolase